MLQYHTVHYPSNPQSIILPQNLTPIGNDVREIILSSTVVTGAALKVKNIPDATVIFEAAEILDQSGVDWENFQNRPLSLLNIAV